VKQETGNAFCAAPANIRQNRIENDLLILTLSRTGTHSEKSLYFVSVHLMQKQQKPDIRFPQDAYAKTHNYVSAGSIEPFIRLSFS